MKTKLTYKEIKWYQSIKKLSFVESYKAIKYIIDRDNYFESLNYDGTTDFFDVTHKDVIFQIKINVDYDEYYYIDDIDYLGELVNETTNRYAIKSKYKDEYYIPYGLEDYDSYGYTYKIANDLKQSFSKLGYSKHDSYLKTLNSFKDEYEFYLESDDHRRYFVDVKVYLKDIEINYECLGFISTENEVYDDHLNVLYDHDLIGEALENAYSKLKELSLVTPA